MPWVETPKRQRPGTELVFRGRHREGAGPVAAGTVGMAALLVGIGFESGDPTWWLASLGVVVVALFAVFDWVATRVDSTRVEVTPSHVVIESGPLRRSRAVMRSDQIVAFRGLALETPTDPWGSVSNVFGVEIETVDGFVSSLPAALEVDDVPTAASLCARLNELLRPAATRDVRFNVVTRPREIEWSERASKDGAVIDVNQGALVFARDALRFGGKCIPLGAIRYFRANEQSGDSSTDYYVEVKYDRRRVRLPLCLQNAREAHFAAARLWEITAALLATRPDSGAPYR